MTVKKLIELLESYSADREIIVRVNDDDLIGNTYVFVNAGDYKPGTLTLWIMDKRKTRGVS